MRTLILFLAYVLVGAGCVERPGRPAGTAAFSVTFLGSPELGTPDRPLAFSAEQEQRFTLEIVALRSNSPDEVDAAFEGPVVLSVQPFGKTAREPHWVNLIGGRATNVEVGIRQAYGPVRLVARDPGYWPAAKASEAACNNLVDDDGDGYLDSRFDRGCFYGDDDTEGGGNGATGASPIITFANPRIADISRPGPNMQDASVLAGTRVTVDRGFMLVTRVSTDGMYITDYDGVRWDSSTGGWQVNTLDMSYRSVFAFNFSTPINIAEGDCLVQLDGSVEEFYGFTELGKPTWKKGDYAFCASLARAAGVPEADCPPQEPAGAPPPCRERLKDLANTPFDLTTMLVDEYDGQHSIWDQRWPGTETERFEAALVQLTDVELFREMHKCDRNGNGLIDYSDNDEKNCANGCGDEATCMVAESFYRYGQWTVSFNDGMGDVVEVNVNSLGAIPKFTPRDDRILSDDAQKTVLRPKTLHKVIGTMRHLTFGRPAWIIEPRRPTDCQLQPLPDGQIQNCNNKE